MVQIPQQEEVIPDVGVIIGRFQVPSLHDGHREVLDFVQSRHNKVLVVLGMTGHEQSTQNNPLDHIARKYMLEEEYPDFEYFYIQDQPSDHNWSHFLDRIVKGHLTASQGAILYGSRDSFLPHYDGRYKTMELETDNPISGTEIRREVKRSRPKNSKQWREGVVYGAFDRFPVNYVTVDIGILNEDGTEILLGQKENEDLWRLPGGFTDATSPSLEHDAAREAREETRLEVGSPEYVGSFRINDWRYRSEVDKIMTTLFITKKMFGTAQGDDDLPTVRWFKLEDLTGEGINIVMPGHRKLVEAILAHERRPGVFEVANRLAEKFLQRYEDAGAEMDPALEHVWSEAVEMAMEIARGE
jgi:bifunctional NMN adenylyltransferase/nudix hydrolase